MKKGAKITVIALICVAVFLGVALGGIAIHESNILRAAEKTFGAVEEYEWDASQAFDVDRYPSITTEDGSVKVLQLTDPHFRNGGTFGSIVGVNYITDGMMKAQVRNLVKTEAPDLIVVTGDLITFANAGYAYREFAAFMDSLDVKWTVTFGNHDAEYNCDKAALLNILRAETKNCLIQGGPTNFRYTVTEDDVMKDGEGNFRSGSAELVGKEIDTGYGNFVITVKDRAGAVRNALILMDSNDYGLAELPDYRFNTPTAGFYPAQVAWYRWVVEGLKAQNGGAVVPTTFYSHIPLDKETDRFGMSDAMIELGSTRFTFSGHTHYEGNSYPYREGAIIQTNGVKAGYNYNDSTGKTGGTAIIIAPDGSISVKFLVERFGRITAKTQDYAFAR